MEPCSRPVPSRRQFHPPITRTVPSRRENLSSCPLPSGPVEEISPYRPVPSTKRAPTTPSRLQTHPYRPVPSSKPVMPSRSAVKTCPNSQIPRSKPVPTVPPRYPLPSLLPVKMPSPSRCRAYYNYYSIYSTNTENVLHLPVERYQAV